MPFDILLVIVSILGQIMYRQKIFLFLFYVSFFLLYLYKQLRIHAMKLFCRSYDEILV